MKYRRRIYYSAGQRAEIWDRWQRGESMSSIGRAFDRQSSVLYLLYLASRIAFAGAKIAFIERQKAPGFLGGITLQAINPKAYAVNTALFSGFAFWPASTSIEIGLKFLVMNIIWIPIHFAWLWAGVALQKLNLPSGGQFSINIAIALSMLAVVALAALAPH